jgi:xylan 1,4-beta-xylosidase
MDHMTSIAFDTQVKGESFKPYWKKCVAAGRAAEGLREDWRQQLREVQREIHFEYIRFHGIFHDDMMIYHEEDGQPVYNFQYLDSLFDFLLEVNLRPFLELSFMPYDLASGEAFVFWWKGNITPPKDYQRWADLVRATIQHCINRYGLDEVLSWYFEVWNEPNLHNGFWSSTQAEYFKLYEVTVQAIKELNPRLRVGGPASSDSGGVKAPWVDEFLAFCKEQTLPVDFVSTHPYPNLWPLDNYGKTIMGYRDEDSTRSDMQRIWDCVDQSPFKQAEIHLTEWNSSPSPRDLIHDTAFMAPFVIMNNLKGLGLADSLAFWTFTDVFEEGRAGNSLFHGGFGMFNTQGLKKPSYYGYWFLARLGSQELLSGIDFIAVRKGQVIQILMWNYCHYTDAFASGDRLELTESERYSVFKNKPPSTFEISITGCCGSYEVTRFEFNREHGSVFDAWKSCGEPKELSKDILAWLQQKTGPDIYIRTVHETKELHLTTIIQPHGVSLIEIKPI